MTLRVVNDTSPRSVAANSPAREQLADLLERRTASERRIKEHQAAIARLSEPTEELARANAALAEFDAAAENEILAWSRASLRKEAPSVDTESRNKLLIAVAEAKDRANFAEGARRKLNQAIIDENRASEDIPREIERAIAEVIVEVALGGMIEDVRTAVRDAMVKQARLQGAVGMLFALGNASGDTTLNREAELLDIALKTASAPEAPSAYPSEWPEFVKALRVDARAEFKF